MEKYIIGFFVVWIVLYLIGQYIHDCLYYNGANGLNSLAKDQLRHDIKASKRPVICMSITIFCAIIFVLNDSKPHLIVGIITFLLFAYYYLFSAKVESAKYLRNALKYAKKKDMKKAMKCAKLSCKYKDNDTASCIVDYNDTEAI